MIAPKEARAKLDDSDANTAFEQRVDNAIEEACKRDHWPCTVALPLSRRIAERVAERYRKAGWSVCIVPDPRDGDFLQLERP